MGNAENFYLKNDGYTRGQAPKLGAVICWRKGKANNANDGAGHVAIVEKINEDGTILCSESNYGGSRFNTRTLKASNSYYLGKNYTFQGFIYLPISFEEEKPKEIVKLKFKIGDRVIINGPLYKSSMAEKSYSSIKNRLTTISRAVTGVKHPYNTTGDLGWMDEKNITLAKTNLEIAKEVIAGKWGNGIARKKRLTEAGYDYKAIQAKVNSLLK